MKKIIIILILNFYSLLGCIKLYQIVADKLYVREGPSLSYEKVGYLNYGDIIKIDSTCSNLYWAKIEIERKKVKGWVCTKYLILTISTETTKIEKEHE